MLGGEIVHNARDRPWFGEESSKVVSEWVGSMEIMGPLWAPVPSQCIWEVKIVSVRTNECDVKLRIAPHNDT